MPMGASGMPCQRLHPLPVGTLGTVRGEGGHSLLASVLFFFFFPFPLGLFRFPFFLFSPCLFRLCPVSFLFSPFLIFFTFFIPVLWLLLSPSSSLLFSFFSFSIPPLSHPLPFLIPILFLSAFPFPLPLSPLLFPSPSSLFHLITFPILIPIPIMPILFPLPIPSHPFPFLLPSQSCPSPGAGGLLWRSALLHPDLHPRGTESSPA